MFKYIYIKKIIFFNLFRIREVVGVLLDATFPFNHVREKKESSLFPIFYQ